MTFVLDASAAASLLFRDETDPDLLLGRFASGERALVTTLFSWEIANLVVSALRRERIGLESVTAQLGRLAQLPIEERRSAERPARVIDLAIARSLTAYDAGYLDLARSEGVPLATRDRKLADAARAEGVGVVPV